MTSPPTDIKGQENACVHRKIASAGGGLRGPTRGVGRCRVCCAGQFAAAFPCGLIRHSGLRPQAS